MTKSNTSTAEAPGAKAETPVYTVETVEKYLIKDISVAISCLNAIQSDPDLLRYMATFMLGRMTNHQAHENVTK